MPIQSPVGTLDFVNARIGAAEIRATSNIGVANVAPTKQFSVGDKFHVSTTDADAVTISGNVVASVVKVGSLEIVPSYDFAAASNVGNTTSNIIQFANATTGFVTTANVEIGGNITLTANAQVKVGSNVLAEYTGPHGRDPKEVPLKKYPEIAFDESKFDGNDTTNTYTQAGYTVTADSQITACKAYKAFDNKFFVSTGNDLNRWQTGNHGYYGSTADTTTGPVTTLTDSTTKRGSYIQLESPHKIIVSRYVIWAQEDSDTFRPKKVILLGSNTGGTDWVSIDPAGEVEPEFVSTGTFPASTMATVSFTNTTAYKYHRLVVRANNGGTVVLVQELELYGREEPSPVGDLSLDTTLKSTFNSVRSNNYVMYFDGDGFIPGDTNSNNLVDNSSTSVIHHNATYDSTGKYWTLDGSTESNVTTGSLGFEGDVPHTVSMWVNSSNLDANAATQQLFSIGSGYDKALVRVDDTQIAANTWHNVTYAYQGEGGSKVTYVDGRKVEEAQVEDTFGDYPPFAMDDYEVGGYRVSASDDGAYHAWKAFNDTTADTVGWYSLDLGDYNGTNGTVTTTSTIRLAPETEKGAWLQLEFPYLFKLNYFTLYAQSDSPTTNTLDNLVLYGKKHINDTWTSLGTFTGIAAQQSSSGVSLTVNANETYKYFAIVATKRFAANVGNGVSIRELKYYGHKEGDLTRFPEPTRVLKYPHIAMTGPAQRGYVASGNNVNSTYPPWKAFDGIFWSSADQLQRWEPTPGYYPTDGGDVTNSNAGLTTLADTTTSRGDYIQLESPHKLIITQFKIFSGTGLENFRVDKVRFLGSNTGGTDWIDLGSGDITLPAYSGTGADYATTATVSNTNAYKYHRLVVRSIHGGGVGDLPVVFQLQYFGTEEDTGTPAIVGGPFAGKVANFRVYDKYLGDERIQEIYDAQKDTFGHKKSSMTFYKGRIGVGTTEPEGALTVIDEPHALAKFPARAVSADDSYVEGDGEIVIRTADGSGYQAFDGLTSTSWTAAPTRNTRLSEEVDFGAWLKIQTPESVSLKKAEIESKAVWNQVGANIYGGAASTELGRGNSVSHDGTRVVLASLVSGGNDEGFVRVYDWNGTSWSQVGQQLNGSTGESNAGYFGRQNHISGDGNYIVAAESLEAGTAGGDAGKVHVYYLNGSTWTTLPDSSSLTNANDAFEGSSSDSYLGAGGVKLSYDGKILAMSEYGYDDPTIGINAGQVNVYYYLNGAWTRRGSATDMIGEATGDLFGQSIDMSEDGNHIIASVRSTLSDRATYVKVYKWNGNNYILKGTKLTYPGGANVIGDDFGSYVSISNDGNTIAISAKKADTGDDGSISTDQGAVYMFTYDDSTSDWVLKDTIGPDSYGWGTQYFGTMICLSGDGQRLLISAANATQAHIQVYEKYGDKWNVRQPSKSSGIYDFSVVSSATSGLRYIGWGADGLDKLMSLSRDGSTIVTGDPYAVSSFTNEGLVRIYNMPSNIKSIWGSNDDVNWTKITTAPTREEATSNVAGVAFGYHDRVEFRNLNNPNYYKYHAIVADAFTRLKDVKLFGVRKQGSSTLHDGALTLTKNLDVPRIGPALDADDTPRRDRLVLEYNTSANPLEDGMVRDTSGRGNNGKMHGNVSYDSSHKAFTFDGSGDMIDIPIPRHMLGDPTLTVSIWVKPLSIPSGSWDMYAHVGRNTDSQQIQLTYYDSSGGLHIGGYGQNIQVTNNYILNAGTWYHLCMTIQPGAWSTSNKKLYVNGSLVSGYLVNSGTTNISDDDRSRISFGGLVGESYLVDHEAHCFMSNMKVYDCALTATEVKTLYDMGRCDEGHRVVNFSKTRVGIGLGDGEAPQATLDVRGDTFSRVFKGGRATFLTWDYLGQRVTTITAPANASSYPNEADILDYTFDIPSCYHDLKRANLKAYVKIDWRGEVGTPWNFGFRIEVTYNGNTLIHSSSSDAASSYNNRVCGIPTISYFNDNNSTPEHASVTSLFNLPDCDVSPGSTLKVQLKGSGGDYTSGHTIWTGKVMSSTNQPDYEHTISSFFVILDVVDGY